MASQSTPMAPANLWALAASAILSTTDSFGDPLPGGVSSRRVPRYDCLGGATPSPEEMETAKNVLNLTWNVPSRENLAPMIQRLTSEGLSAEYRKAAARLQQSPETRADRQLAFVSQYGAALGTRALLAYDLARLLSIAGWGFLAGYCNEAEAWATILPAADRLRDAYASWEEYGQNYKLGALFAIETDSLDVVVPNAAAHIDQVLAHLRSAPDSPWTRTPWRLDANAQASASSEESPGARTAGAASAASAPRAPAGAAGSARQKSRTGLLLGLGAGGLIVLGLAGGLIWHFTHEHDIAHSTPAAPAGKPHPHH